MPFKWGGFEFAHDCCTFAAGAFDLMTGSKHVEQLLENYHDEASALAYIERNGGLANLVGQYLGDQKPVKAIRTGDAALVARGPLVFVGVCLDHMIVSASERGLVWNRIDRVTACWSV